MTNENKNLVTMYGILTGWALDPDHIAVTNKVPVFKQGMMGVKSRYDLINSLSDMLSITGIAQDKEQARTFLCQVLMSITMPVKSFSIMTKNNTLKEEVKTAFSKYMKMRALTLINKAQRIHGLVLPMIAELEAAGFTITDSDMAILQESIARFTGIFNSPETAIEDRKSVNMNINTYVKEANAVCHDILDENIISFKDDPMYRQEFKIKRHVNKLGLHHTRLEATVVNELGVPYPYCTVTVNEFTKKGKTYKAVSGYTDANGQAIIRKFEAGVRSVTVSGDGIVTKNCGTFSFENGRAVSELFVCQPAFIIPAPQQQQAENA